MKFNLFYVLLFVSLTLRCYAQLDPFTSAFGPRTAEIKAAAEAGDAKAQFKLGQAYSYHWSNAVVWFRKSARQGNADAQHALGNILLDGASGVPANPTEALSLLNSSAGQGNQNAQVRLGKIYQEGKHVKREYPESFKWFSLADHQGSIMGRVYLDEVVLKMSPEEIAEGKRRASSFVLNSPIKSLPPLKLQGITGAGKRSMAIISGKNLMVGDEETMKVDDELLKVKCLGITNGFVTIFVAGEAQPRVLQMK